MKEDNHTPEPLDPELLDLSLLGLSLFELFPDLNPGNAAQMYQKWNESERGGRGRGATNVG